MRRELDLSECDGSSAFAKSLLEHTLILLSIREDRHAPALHVVCVPRSRVDEPIAETELSSTMPRPPIELPFVNRAIVPSHQTLEGDEMQDGGEVLPGHGVDSLSNLLNSYGGEVKRSKEGRRETHVVPSLRVYCPFPWRSPSRHSPQRGQRDRRRR